MSAITHLFAGVPVSDLDASIESYSGSSGDLQTVASGKRSSGRSTSTPGSSSSRTRRGRAPAGSRSPLLDSTYSSSASLPSASSTKRSQPTRTVFATWTSPIRMGTRSRWPSRPTPRARHLDPPDRTAVTRNENRGKRRLRGRCTTSTDVIASVRDLPDGPSQAGGAARRAVSTLERLAEQPQQRRPKAHEQRPAFGVTALTLIVGLGSDPEADTQGNGRRRTQMQVPASQPDAMEEVDEHDRLLPVRRTPLTRRIHATSPPRDPRS